MSCDAATVWLPSDLVALVLAYALQPGAWHEIFAALCGSQDYEAAAALVRIMRPKAPERQMLWHLTLDKACEAGNEPMVWWLIAYFGLSRGDLLFDLGAGRGGLSESAFALACAGGHLRLVKQLAIWARLRRRDIRRCGILQVACIHGRAAVVSWICRHFQLARADVAKDGYLVWNKACGGGHLQVVKQLVRRFRLNNTDLAETGGYPLYYARQGGHFGLVAWLAQAFRLSQKDVAHFMDRCERPFD